MVNYFRLLNDFQLSFIQSIPAEIRTDVRIRMINPYHTGPGMSNNDVINIVRSIFNQAAYNQDSLATLQYHLIYNLDDYVKKPENARSQTAVKNAKNIIYEVLDVIALHKIPFEIQLCVLNKISSIKDICNLRVVSKNMLKMVEVTFLFQRSTKSFSLAEQLKSLPYSKHDFMCVIGTRNTVAAFRNLTTALTQYAIKGDLTQKFTTTQASGQYSIDLPDTIEETFKNALKKEEDTESVIQQTLTILQKSMTDCPVRDRKLEMAAFIAHTDKILEFIRTIFKQ